MANLFFPQLSSGAVAQYPIRKVRLTRTIKNVLPDGRMILSADPSGRLVWELGYTELSESDVDALKGHFSSCYGSYRAFTFIDPTENMLGASISMTAPAWQISPLIQLSHGIADPEGGTTAVMLVNTGQASQEISQTLAVPANYQYCFSLFVMSSQPTEIVLVRRGSSAEVRTTYSAGPVWSRIVSSGRLNDSSATLTAGISLAPGQQIGIYGAQLEPQIAPSRYRPTAQTGGVFANAHWGVQELAITADGPNLFSTAFTIETAI